MATTDSTVSAGDERTRRSRVRTQRHRRLPLTALAALSLTLGVPAVLLGASELPAAAASAPIVTAVTSDSGAAGDTVTISGSNLASATTVTFGTVAATSISADTATSLQAIVPTQPSFPIVGNTVDVTVTTGGGTSATSVADGFTYIYNISSPTTTISITSPAASTTVSTGTAVTLTATASQDVGPLMYGITLWDVTNPGSPVWVAHTGSGTSTSATVSQSTDQTRRYVAELDDCPSTSPPAATPADICPSPAPPTDLSAVSQPVTITWSTPAAPTTNSYDMVGSDGGVFVFPVGAGSGFYGSLPGLGIQVNNIVGIVPTASHHGYWLVGSDGGVFAFGDAGFLGSLPGLGIQVNDIAAIVPTATDNGYWLVGRDGGVFAFGDAGFLGSLPGLGVHVSDIVGIASTANDSGYWLVGADGSVYAIGVPYLGGANGSSSPIVGIAATHSGNGYWVVSASGTVSNFGDAAFHSDLPSIGVSVSNIVSIVPTSDGGGYWLIGSDGGVFAFPDAGFAGSLPGLGINVTDVVGAVPTS